MSIITQFKTTIENAIGYPTPLLSVNEAITESALILNNVHRNFNLLTPENRKNYGYDALLSIKNSIDENHVSMINPALEGVNEQRRVNNILFDQQSLQKDFNKAFAYLTSNAAPRAENEVLDAAHALRDARIKADQARAESIAKANAAFEKANARVETAEEKAANVIGDAQAKSDQVKAQADAYAARVKEKADQNVNEVIDGAEKLIEHAAEDAVLKAIQAEQACRYAPAVQKLTDADAPAITYVEATEVESTPKNRLKP